jgi:hypothetical protein
MIESLSGKRNSQETWNELPKPFARALQADIFREKIGRTTVGEQLVDESAPFIRDIKEVNALVRRREIEPENYNEYIFSSPEFMKTAFAAFKTAEAAAKNTTVPKNIIQATRAATQLQDKLMAAIHAPSSQAGETAEAMSNIAGYFSAAYIESLYLRTAMAQLRATPSSKESGLLNQMRSAEVLFQKKSSISPRLRSIATFMECAKGRFFETLRVVNDNAAALAQSGEDRIESLHDMQQRVLSGQVPSPAYSQTVTPLGVIQVVIQPPNEKEREEEYAEELFNDLPRILATVRINIAPAGQTGYFKADPVAPDSDMPSGAYFYISGEKGRLEISGASSTSLNTLLLSDTTAELINTHILSLAHESFTGNYRIGSAIPDSAEADAVMQASLPELSGSEAASTEHEETGSRLPRDMRGEDIIATIGRMNRAFLRDKGLSGEELDRQSDPFIRQKGSHATIYCAETDRIAPVPIHARALPVGTLRSILRILNIDPGKLQIN